MRARNGQLTIRKVSSQIQKSLKRKAAQEKTSMNSTALDAIERGLGLADEPVRHHDLDHLAGVWKSDRKLDQALAAQRKIDRAMWR